MGITKKAEEIKGRYTEPKSTMYTKAGDIIRRYSPQLTHQPTIVGDTIHLESLTL